MSYFKFWRNLFIWSGLALASIALDIWIDWIPRKFEIAAIVVGVISAVAVCISAIGMIAWVSKNKKL